MKTMLLAAVAAVTLAGNAFALIGANGTGLNLGGLNGTSFNLSGMNPAPNSSAIVDLNSLRVLGAAIRR